MSIAWIRKRICLPGYNDRMWEDAHDRVLETFFRGGVPVLIAYVADDVLVLGITPGTLRQVRPKRFMYFLRKSPSKKGGIRSGSGGAGSAASKVDKSLALADLPTALRIGSARGTELESFLNQMNVVFVPGVGRGMQQPYHLVRPLLPTALGLGRHQLFARGLVASPCLGLARFGAVLDTFAIGAGLQRDAVLAVDFAAVVAE